MQADFAEFILQTTTTAQCLDRDEATLPNVSILLSAYAVFRFCCVCELQLVSNQCEVFLHRNTRSHHSINVLEERNTVTNNIRMYNQGLANALFTGVAINSDRGGQCVVLK